MTISEILVELTTRPVRKRKSVAKLLTKMVLASMTNVYSTLITIYKILTRTYTSPTVRRCRHARFALAARHSQYRLKFKDDVYHHSESRQSVEGWRGTHRAERCQQGETAGPLRTSSAQMPSVNLCHLQSNHMRVSKTPGSTRVRMRMHAWRRRKGIDYTIIVR